MRFDNWPDILDSQIKDVQNTPFEWGIFDCCMFAADVVLAMTGNDYAADFRGRYKTKRGSISVLKKSGHESLAWAITDAIGPPLDSINFLQRGDVVMFDGGNGLAAGICLGAKCAGAGDIGLVYVETCDCICGWRV